MKNENEFNAALSKKLRMLQPKVFSMKTSDKFTVGVSDFLVFGYAKTLALETKFVREWPSSKALLLGHTFTGEQQTFLESMALAGHSAVGLVGVEEAELMYIVNWNQIPREGNWNTSEFRSLGFPMLNWMDAPGLVKMFLG